MTRRAMIGSLCALALCLVSLPAWGMNSGRYTGKFVGTIFRIVGNTIQVEVPEIEKTVSFWTDDMTKVTRDKTRLKFSDLKVGQVVTVEASKGRAKKINIDQDVKADRDNHGNSNGRGFVSP